MKMCSGTPRKDAAMAQKDSDLRKIKELIKIMKDNELVEVEIKNGEEKIFLKRSKPQQVVKKMPVVRLDAGERVENSQAAEIPSMPSSTQPESVDESLAEINSPIVGTFYATPSPDSDPYVEVGTVVGPQTVVCIIEAMKVLNEIKAETSGTIVEVLVTSGQAVEYGQALFRVKPEP
jgi:acetyl-CoA carboxylase biotin carboxyl carrier protein